MAQPLMQRAQAQKASAGGEDRTQFEPKDPKQFVPPELHDTVDRIVAAGMKLAYSPEMADERQQFLASQDPMPKRLADNVTGLMLTLDQHSKGGIPQAAIFPAGVLLVNEAAEMAAQGGATITQDDYNEALQILYVQLGKKLHLSDDQLMGAAEQALKQKGGADDESAETTPDDETAEGDPGAVGGAGPMTAAYPGTSTPPAGVAMAGAPVRGG